MLQMNWSKGESTISIVEEDTTFQNCQTEKLEEITECQIFRCCRWIGREESLQQFLHTMGCFIYILDSSNSSSITFWTNQFGSSSRSNWIGIWTGNSNGIWTDKQSSHFSTAKEMSVKATWPKRNIFKSISLVQPLNGRCNTLIQDTSGDLPSL